jgi:hypothetical protein
MLSSDRLQCIKLSKHCETGCGIVGCRRTSTIFCLFVRGFCLMRRALVASHANHSVNGSNIVLVLTFGVSIGLCERPVEHERRR